mmetsp:Transcript_116583/g.329724  ORF Transcript_116583/g.329724 Transcript_116583/m.329724 type:complete len:231 (-) Transcript_116583:81-773(-)
MQKSASDAEQKVCVRCCVQCLQCRERPAPPVGALQPAFQAARRMNIADDRPLLREPLACASDEPTQQLRIEDALRHQAEVLAQPQQVVVRRVEDLQDRRATKDRRKRIAEFRTRYTQTIHQENAPSIRCSRQLQQAYVTAVGTQPSPLDIHSHDAALLKCVATFLQIGPALDMYDAPRITQTARGKEVHNRGSTNDADESLGLVVRGVPGRPCRAAVRVLPQRPMQLIDR